VAKKTTYAIIQPPFDLKFREMTKKDLAAYREWFHAVVPKRIAEPAKAVKASAPRRADRRLEREAKERAVKSPVIRPTTIHFHCLLSVESG
jgi:hypothetical protein